MRLDSELERAIALLPGDWIEALVWFLPDDHDRAEDARAACGALGPPAVPEPTAGAGPYVAIRVVRCAGEDPLAEARAALRAIDELGLTGRVTRAALQRRSPHP